MKIDTSNNLEKEKRKISFLFTVSIFLIIIFLELSFLGFKYFDYQRNEFGRLQTQTEAISRLTVENPNFEMMLMEGKILFGSNFRPMMPGFGNQMRQGNQERRGRIQNFFFYDKSNGNILFSPIEDDDFYKEIIGLLNYEDDDFDYNGQEYFYIIKDVSERVALVSFMESKVSLTDIFKELGIYMFFAILLSLLIYFLSFKFVSRTLKPVEENINDMEQFIHNAGHELKTPISVIKSYLQLAKLKKNFAEASTESLRELDKMNDLIQALINLSTIKGNSVDTSISVNDFIVGITAKFEDKMKDKNLKLAVIDKEKLNINADFEYFGIFLNNIISNAIKYNKEKGEISIIIDKNSLEIKDTGIGIDNENLDKVFDRFYQESEGREENSSGIGLSIVKKIADIYNWRIEIKSEKGIGTNFIVRF